MGLFDLPHKKLRDKLAPEWIPYADRVLRLGNAQIGHSPSFERQQVVFIAFVLWLEMLVRQQGRVVLGRNTPFDYANRQDTARNYFHKLNHQQSYDLDQVLAVIDASPVEFALRAHDNVPEVGTTS